MQIGLRFWKNKDRQTNNNKGNRTDGAATCERGPGDSFELPLGKHCLPVAPLHAPLLQTPLLQPKHFCIIQRGPGQEVTEVDLEYIWAKKQMRLVYLSTSHRLLSLFLCSRPQRCQLRLPADKKEKTPSAPISLTARRRGYKESESEGSGS